MGLCVLGHPYVSKATGKMKSFQSRLLGELLSSEDTPSALVVEYLKGMPLTKILLNWCV